MSIRSHTHKVKAEVKCYGFWRKTSTAKTKETVSTYIMSYLDETSKAAALEASRKLGDEARKVGYAAVQHGVSAPQELGIDYLTKEEKGKIRAYGFLRDDVASIGGKPSHQLDNDDRIIACHRAWMQRMEEHPKGKKFAHKYVFSLDPRFCELMGAAGKDCDALLVQGARTVMRRFLEKFYPGDRLGYLVGIHHDRKHLHAHILLFPYTEKGQHLRVTDGEDDKRFHDLRKVADKFVRDYFFKEFEVPVRASDRPVDKVMQTRVVSSIAWASFPKGTLPDTDKLAWAANEKRRLQALSEAELRAIIAKRQDTLLVSYRDTVLKLQGKPQDVKTILQNIGRQQVDIKQKIQETDGKIKAAKEQQAKLMGEFQNAQKELSTFRFYRAEGRGHGRPIYEAETWEQRDWLAKLFAKPDTAVAGRAAFAPGQYPLISSIICRGVLKPHLTESTQSSQRNRDILRTALSIRLEELKAEQSILRANLRKAYDERQGLLVVLEAVKLTESMVTSAGRGRTPMFLEQHEGMKRAGVELPILCRSIRPEDVVASRETARAVTSFEDLNRKILSTLRAFQGSTTEDDVFEVDRYFRTITDATTPAKKAVQKEAEEAEVRKQLETQTVQEFLNAQNIRQSRRVGEGTAVGPAIPAATATLEHLHREVEFDL